MCRNRTCALRSYARIRGHGNGAKWFTPFVFFLQRVNDMLKFISKIHEQLCRQWIQFEWLVLTAECTFGWNFSVAALPKTCRKAFGSTKMQYCDVELELADADYAVFIKFAALALPQMITNLIVVNGVWTRNDIRTKTVFISIILRVRWQWEGYALFRPAVGWCWSYCLLAFKWKVKYY